jgi:integrase
MMQYHGIYAELIEQYITFKRSLGYALENVYTFSMFDRFTVEHNVSAIGLTRELTDKWAEKRTNESDVTRYKRVNDIANFSKFLNHIGYPSYIPRQMKAYHSTFTPHIFSKEELNAFFHACDCLEITGYSNATYILPAAFRMIYGCGLRTNEAMSLRCRDVNLEKNYIIIRNPKNGRDRMLPLSDSVTDVCIRYRNCRLRSHGPEDYFFTKNDMTRCSTDTLYRWFRNILWKAGIPHGGRGVGPRVHDLRHTFSVHSLAAMSEAGLDLYYSLPILSKYLGHQSLEATDKYVRLTSEMYPELIRGVNNICAYVFPEVKLP